MDNDGYEEMPQICFQGEYFSFLVRKDGDHSFTLNISDNNFLRKYYDKEEFSFPVANPTVDWDFHPNDDTDLTEPEKLERLLKRTILDHYYPHK